MKNSEEKIEGRYAYIREWDKNLKPYLVIFGGISGGRYAYSRKHALEIFKRGIRRDAIHDTYACLSYQFRKWGRVKNLRFVRYHIDGLLECLKHTQDNSNFYVELLFEPIDKYNTRVMGVFDDDFVYKEGCWGV